MFEKLSTDERKELLINVKRALETNFSDYQSLIIDIEKFTITLKIKSKSGFTTSLSISAQEFKILPLHICQEIPKEWKHRITTYHNFKRNDDETPLDCAIRYFKLLINEDSSVLIPLDQPIYPLEVQQEQLQTIVKNFRALTEAYREDFTSEEAKRAKNELLQYLEEDSTLVNIWHSEIKGCYHIGGVTYRLYLIEYKGFGFLLTDVGNSHWKFAYTVEEFLMTFHWNEVFHNILQQ